MSYLFRQPTGNSPSSSSSSSVPPSAFQRRGSNNNGVGGLRANSQSAEKNARRVSRTDMDFEQALKTGGTVVLEEGRRLESLGDGSSVASSSKGPNVTPRNRVATDPIVWNSPIVIPPTPTPSTTVQRPSTASSLSTGSHLPAMYGAYNIDDMDMQMKRRSLFRSAGTSSSPDLATLLIKAKQRGGVVGSTSNTTTTDEDSSAETASASHKNPAPETSVSASGHLHPDPSNSNVEERSRTRTRSSSSSSYSIVSSNISISESPPSKSQSRGTKAEKILGMSGIVGIGSVDGFSPNKNQAKDSKTLRSTVRNKTSAFWTRMTGQGTTRERSGSTTCTSGGTSIPNTPVTPSYATSFSTYSAGSSLNVSPTTPKLSVSPAPPVPPLPSNYRSRPAVGSDVFTSPSSNKPLPIRPSTARPSTAHSQPKKTEVVSSDEEVDLDQALQLAPPRTSNKANQKSFHGRRRSLSVGDVVIDIRPGGRYSLDQRQPSPLGGGGQPSPKSSNEQSDGPGPESAPPSAFPLSEKNMLEGWNLPSVGIGGFRGAFDSYTTTPTSLVSSPKTESFGPISSQRPSRARSHTTTVPLQSGSGLQQGSPNPDELDLSRRPSTASMASASTADSSGSHFQNDYRPLGPPPPLSGIKKRVVRPHHQRHNPQLSISSDKTAIQGNNNAEESGEDGFVTAGTGTDTDVDVSSPSSAISKQPGSAVSSATSTGFSSGFPSRSTSLRARSGSNPTVSSHSNGGGGGHPPSLRGGPLPSNRGGEPAFKFTSPSYESLTLRKSRSQSRNQADSMGMVIRRGSDDAAMGGGGGGNVNLENGRTVRLGISPSMVPGHLLQQMRAAGGSMSSLDVSSGGAGAGGGQVNAVDEELLEERGKEAAEKCWNEDESFKPREKIAEYLGGVGRPKAIALKYYMDRFDFTGLRLDNAFRHLCGKLYLRAETQQVDRILVEFSRRYYECNPSSVYGSASIVHSVSYSLLLLNTDLHVAELSNRMSRNQFIKNTMSVIVDSLKEGGGSGGGGGGVRGGGLEAGRASTPELSSTFVASTPPAGQTSGDVDNSTTTTRGSGSGDVEATVKIRSKRSGSMHSWKSASREAFPGIGNGSTPHLPGTTTTSTSDVVGKGTPPSTTPTATLGKSSGSGMFGRSWENDLEAVLKEMYNAIRAQQILQPTFAAERPSTSSSTPHNTMIARRGSQRSHHGPPDRHKRGSIRGISTLLTSQQSPYSSNSSVDGRVSPSPSFATSINEAISTSSSSIFTPTLGFASNLSHTIIKEAQEDDASSVASVDSEDSAVSITDEELALLGPPWAKEGMLCRKQYWESAGKRAKNKTWMDVFVVIQKGELSMFTFGEGGGTTGGGQVGGGNWLSNAQPVGTVQLAHSLAHGLPPPGYNRTRPHCFVLTLASDAVYFFQAGTEDLVNEWVSTCNYWAARLSKEPLSGGVSNMEYGWNRVTDMFGSNPNVNGQDSFDDYNDAFSVRSGRSRLSKRSWTDTHGRGSLQYSPFAMDKIYINEWKPPMTSTVPSTHDEETQMEALQRQVALLKSDLAVHDKIQVPIRNLYPPRSANLQKAQNNWEQKSKYLMAEIFKYETYVESLQNAMNLRLKRRGEKVLEKALVDGLGPDDDNYMSKSATSVRSGGRGLQQETIQEADEPSTPGPNAVAFGGLHRREVAGIDRDDD